MQTYKPESKLGTLFALVETVYAACACIGVTGVLFGVTANNGSVVRDWDGSCGQTTV